MCECHYTKPSAWQSHDQRERFAKRPHWKKVKQEILTAHLRVPQDDKQGKLKRPAYAGLWDTRAISTN